MAEPFLRADAPVNEPAVPLADYAGGAAVRLAPADDPRALVPHLGTLRLVEIAFPAFTDGRGMSSARMLREAGYTGELRAVGDVLVDQLAAMVRCGFDAFAPDVPLDAADTRTALARWPDVYQPAADRRAPIWALRHG